MRTLLLLPGLVVAALCVAVLAPRPSGAALATLGGEQYRITGPYAHEGVAVYLLHSAKQDGREFLTLAEGLKAGVLTVREKPSAEVNELLVSNSSSLPLFLQEGDTLEGGQQDRTFFSSLVVPPKTKDMPVPAFCIEPDRWQPGDTGAAFTATDFSTLAPKSVRQAAKYEKDQSRVWEEVDSTKKLAATRYQVSSRTTSLNEALGSEKLKRRSEELSRALKDLPARHADAVGVAIAVDGQVEEVNVYPGNPLLRKLYPRVLRSYALQAGEGRRAPATPAPATEVARFVREEPARQAARAEEFTAFGARQGVERRAGVRPLARRSLTPNVRNPFQANIDVSRGLVAGDASLRNAGTTMASPQIIHQGLSPAAPPEASLPVDRVEQLSGGNALRVQERPGSVASVTEYAGRPVHRQIMRK